MVEHIEDFLDGYAPAVREVPICGRPALIAEHAKIEAEISGPDYGLAGPPAELVDRLAELEAEIEASVRVFRLEALSQQAWADLLAEHPPSPSKGQDDYAWDPDTFEPAALVACSPDAAQITHARAERTRAVLPPGEWQTLIRAILDLHKEHFAAPKSWLLSARHHLSDASLSTPPSEESLDQGSLGGSGEQ